MPGLYLHIPYCRKACSYCDFYFTTSPHSRTQFVDALLTEAATWSDKVQPWGAFHTVYFGGGTPSQLSLAELERIFVGLHQHFSIAPQAEITLEANPEDLSTEYLKGLLSLGINRLSIGVQSLDDGLLRWLGRNHDAATALAAVARAQDAGIHNLSIDLIYAIPGLSTQQWAQTLKTAFSLGVPHLSAYGLTIEEKTFLGWKARRGQLTEQPDDEFRRQFMLLHETALAYGWQHYELSNLCLPGHHSRHNSSYWQGTPYLGLGPAAHSYSQGSRWHNVSSVWAYIDALAAETSAVGEREMLDQREQYHDLLITSLRTEAGLLLSEADRLLGFSFYRQFSSSLHSGIDSLQLSLTNDRLRILPQAWPMADFWIQQFMLP